MSPSGPGVVVLIIVVSSIVSSIGHEWGPVNVVLETSILGP